MKFRDLLGMSISSLWRRKVRTILTILGVVIGTASIVVMISLGLGLDRAQMEQVEQYGGLTTINVYSSDSGYYYGETGSGDEEPLRISDETIEMLSQLDYVESVAPLLQTNAIVRQGVWEGSINLIGTTPQALEEMNMELTAGSELPVSDAELKFFYGNAVIADFYNAKTNQYPYWETGEVPDVDFMEPMFVIFDTDAYWNSKWGGTDESGNPIAAPKKYMVESSGVMAGGPDDYSGEGSWNVYCNVDALKAQMQKVFKGKVIPGQPTTKAGKPYKEIYYNQANVKVTDMKYMEEVQKVIQGMGYTTYSNIEWVNQMREQSRSIQAALGGIGAVSLFVAAIGIANTMMMSIYERTKEIGIMKVLGCGLSKIRNMFLAEAAFIGLIGGAIGLMLSYGISAIINMFTQGMYAQDSSGISYIPLWLSLLALFFAMVVGILSGLLPALRAMRLSPLAAIRNE
ncbi:MAG: ABC transporter permease [Lachnospiraceae bacterium]|nr:ABC transporter permease [Lachnospiraceae bacterium]